MSPFCGAASNRESRALMPWQALSCLTHMFFNITAITSCRLLCQFRSKLHCSKETNRNMHTAFIALTTGTGPTSNTPTRCCHLPSERFELNEILSMPFSSSCCVKKIWFQPDTANLFSPCFLNRGRIARIEIVLNLNQVLALLCLRLTTRRRDTLWLAVPYDAPP